MKRFFNVFKDKHLNTTRGCGKLFLVSILLLKLSVAYSANNGIGERTRIYTREISSDSLILLIDNHMSIPVTAQVNLDLENLGGEHMSEFTAVIPARAANYTLAGFKKVSETKPYRCSYTWKIVMGDVSQVPDLAYLYQYPFLKRNRYKISQGPGGEISHKNIFAYDFVMPVGTPIVAAREGIIASVKSNSALGGPYSIYSDHANFISVYHADGTIANYFHLKKDGVIVKEGQQVKRGELIGYSGSTGFSSGPHLHFEVVRPGADFEKNQWIVFNWDDTGSRSQVASNKKSATQAMNSANSEPLEIGGLAR